jgi:GT2 family glycosyltransferase
LNARLDRPVEELPDYRLALVVLTHNRRGEVLKTLDRLTGLERAFPVCVVDNGSDDGSADAIARDFPAVELVRLPRNLGAAGRNFGVRRMHSRYIAFCDDDTWWEEGALTRAVEIMDAHPKLGVATARILVGPENREDPTSTLMADSPLANTLSIPGSETTGFMAGACVMRRDAFLAAGGYEPRFFLGGEESLLALDIQARGWRLGYLPDLVLHHHPSRFRDASARRRLLLRNALWCAWLRRPAPSAWRETVRRLRELPEEPQLMRGHVDALRGLPWVWRQRRVLPSDVESRLRQVENSIYRH